MAFMPEYYEIVKKIFNYFDYLEYKSDNRVDRFKPIIEVMDYVLGLESNEIRFKSNKSYKYNKI